MSHTPRTWRPETRPYDCFDWITPEDVCRHALAAFYLAKESMKQPPGRRFAEPDGLAWSSRESFGDNLALLFEMRVKTDGYHLGVAADWATDAKQLQLWTRPPQWTHEDLQHPEISTDSGGMGGTPMERSGTAPALRSSHSPDGPAGPSMDAGNSPKTTPCLPCAP